MVTDVVPPVAAIGLTIEMASVLGIPACVTVMDWGEMPLAETVRMAVREPTVALALAETLRVCVPVPELTLVDNQGEELETDQLVLDLIVTAEGVAKFIGSDNC